MQTCKKKKKDESENGTYEYSSSISTSTKMMIPTLEMFGRATKPQTDLNLPKTCIIKIKTGAT